MIQSSRGEVACPMDATIARRNADHRKDPFRGKSVLHLQIEIPICSSIITWLDRLIISMIFQLALGL